jgi:L-lactate dehydrogenase complex protein LldE
MASVALFDPCYTAALRPGDAAHARRVLTALGDDVSLIDGRCCGQPAFNSGFRPEARQVGRELLRAAQAHATIVTPSGSCVSMVRHYLPGLFEGERRAGAASIANRFREFTDYVAGHPRLDDVILKLEGTVAYHDACHARRELGLTQRSRSLLARIEGLEVRSLAHEDECCGFGGAFSVKLPEVSVAMMAAKLEDVSATGAHVLVSGDFSCLAHLESGARGTGLRLETWSMAELLSKALG